MVRDPVGSYWGLVEFKGLTQKIQQTATKDSTNGHKRLNKQTQKTQQTDAKDSTNGTIHHLKWRKMTKFSIKSFTKDSTNSTKDSTKRQKTQQRAQKTQQRDTKDSTKRHKRLNK